MKRGRKHNPPAAPGRNVRELPASAKIALLGSMELAKLKAAWEAVTGAKLPPREAAERLARDLPYYQEPPAAGAGRKRDPELERAARMYIAAVASKETLRTQGYSGLDPEKVALARIAAQCFPRDDVEKAGERIKNAAKKYRKKTPG